LESNGTVWAWGDNSSGQLGNGTTLSSSIAVQVSNIAKAIAIAAGSGHCLAAKSDGTVWAWGDNRFGELGNGATSESYVPLQIARLTGVVGVAAGSSHNLIVKSDAPFGIGEITMLASWVTAPPRIAPFRFR